MAHNVSLDGSILSCSTETANKVKYTLYLKKGMTSNSLSKC